MKSSVLKTLIVASLMSLCFIASAQVYVGGSISGAVKNSSNADVKQNSWSFNVQPAVGYLLNDNWAIGGRISYNLSKSKTERVGYDYQSTSNSNVVVINPYAAYSPLRSGNFALWAEFGLRFAPKMHSSDYATYGAYIVPALTYDLNDHFVLKSNLGFASLSVSGTSEGGLRYIGVQSGVLKKYDERIRYVRGVHTIAEGIWLVPHRRADYSSIALRNELYTITNGEHLPDDFAHEQSLVIETGKGLVVFNSCSHTGMTNILTDIREMLDRSDVYAYVGGLHLYKMTDEELAALSGEILRNSVSHIFTGHCTGNHAFSFLKERLDGRIEQFSSGFKYCF